MTNRHAVLFILLVILLTSCNGSGKDTNFDGTLTQFDPLTGEKLLMANSWETIDKSIMIQFFSDSSSLGFLHHRTSQPEFNCLQFLTIELTGSVGVSIYTAVAVGSSFDVYFRLSDTAWITGRLTGFDPLLLTDHPSQKIIDKCNTLPEYSQIQYVNSELTLWDTNTGKSVVLY